MLDQTNRRLSSITLLVIFLACVSIWAVPDTAEAETQSLVVETVPAIEGIQFQLDGETFVTDEAGVAQMTTETQKGYGMLEVAEHSLIGDSQRVEFEAWSDGVVTATRAVEFLESSPAPGRIQCRLPCRRAFPQFEWRNHRSAERRFVHHRG